LEECFSTRTIIPSLQIGSHLEALANNLGRKYTTDHLINKHTILPYYAPFLPKERRDEIINNIKYKNGSGTYTQIGIVAGSICKRDGIYYCSQCSKHEHELKGEAYIHREHQLQGIGVCAHHGIVLKKYKIDKNDVSRLEFIKFSRELLEFENETINTALGEIMQKLAKDAYYLLNFNYEPITKEKVLEKYKNLIYERGLTTSSKRIKQRDLYEEFVSFYGKALLKTMDSSIDNDYEYNWLRTITRNSERTVHPVRHLLLINFLGINISDFFNDIDKNYKPFGEGPWPCLNKVTIHYKESVVKDLKITEDYKTRLPVGTFSCDCGFIYSRKGPDVLDSDKYRIGRIKSFGEVWENKLLVYLKERKYGLRELARFMKCDPKTIIKFDNAFGINYFKGKVEAIKSKVDFNNNIDRSETYKKSILNYIHNNVAATRTEIREMCKKEYIYLYRKDKRWLKQKLPMNTKEIKSSNKVDWNSRDYEVLALVKASYEALIDSEIPVRITISHIGKEIGKLAELEKNLSKLPETGRYLSESIETIEEFQIRRCKKILNEKVHKGDQFKQWEIQRLAGIRNKEFQKIIGIINTEDGSGLNGKNDS
jgi:hypothetical protein